MIAAATGIVVIVAIAWSAWQLTTASSTGDESAPTTSCAHGPLWSEAGAACCSSQWAKSVKREEKEGCI